MIQTSPTRIHIGELRRSLFVDWQQSGDLSWGATGRTLQECYGFDPWKITAGSYKASLTQSQRAVCSDQLCYLWKLWSRYDRRRHYLGEQMVELVDSLAPAVGSLRSFRGLPP